MCTRGVHVRACHAHTLEPSCLRFLLPLGRLLISARSSIVDISTLSLSEKKVSASSPDWACIALISSSCFCAMFDWKRSSLVCPAST